MSYPKRDENKPNRDNALFLTNVLRVFTTRWKTYQKSLQESLSDLSSSMRGRQWLHRRVLIIIGVVILVMIACFIFVFDKKPPVRHASSSSEPILIKTDHDSLHTWQVESSETFNALSEAQKKQEKVINSLNEGLNSEKTSIDTLSSQLKDMQLMLEKVSRQRENVVSTAGIAPQRAPAFMNGGEGAYSQNGSNLQSTATFPAMMPRFDKLHEYTPPVEQSIKETKTGNPSVYSRNRKTGWFPTGGFMQSTLLHGLNAATGQYAQANPQPVLLQLMSNAFLPNDYRYRVKRCRVLGSAYGDLSSERVYIRLVSLSCVGFDAKQIVDAKIKGYVVDSDGKLGLRGVVINRQGAKLGMAMLAGFAAGLSDAYSASEGTVNTSSFGTFQSVAGNDVMRQAGFNGLSSSADELAQFYIDAAKQIFPVIVVNAGRNVTLVVSEGVSLQWESTDKAYVANEGQPTHSQAASETPHMPTEAQASSLPSSNGLNQSQSQMQQPWPTLFKKGEPDPDDEPKEKA